MLALDTDFASVLAKAEIIELAKELFSGKHYLMTGGIVELVNPRNTSKQCSVCGCIQSIPLSQRTYECPDCGSVMGRDHNAAINIKNRYVRADCPEFKPVGMVA